MDAPIVTTEEMVDGFHRMQVEHARVVQHIAIQHDLNPTDLRVLKYLGIATTTSDAEAPGVVTPGAVGSYLEMSRGAVTALLDRLEARRLLLRTPNPRDRRGTLLTLTSDGAEVVGRLRQAYARAIEASVPGELQAAFLEGCRSLGRELDAQVTADIARRSGP